MLWKLVGSMHVIWMLCKRSMNWRSCRYNKTHRPFPKSSKEQWISRIVDSEREINVGEDPTKRVSEYLAYTTVRTLVNRSCIKPFMSEIEQNNRYGHHTALPWLVSAYMHIKCTVGRMMANPNDLYSADELKGVCREAERWAIYRVVWLTKWLC